ncbi:MAG: hypothetical protein QM728_13970 [Gordonia sp. (in: high G+C Gram-positive bacteria)]|uniref:hypothetical protein n=1 Tax=Gordonia sp. (in: high G+C Gram-positive bacteria) TaxID=84139 RepID=UPI0039E4555B
MSKVIQIRGLSDEAHAALVRAAQSRGVSLTSYVRGELEAIARRADVAQHNAEVIREARAEIGTRVSVDDIVTAIHEGRGE